MRIIVDANVVISAALSKFSVPFLALEQVLDRHTNLISEKTFEELKIIVWFSGEFTLSIIFYLVIFDN